MWESAWKIKVRLAFRSVFFPSGLAWDGPVAGRVGFVQFESSPASRWSFCSVMLLMYWEFLFPVVLGSLMTAIWFDRRSDERWRKLVPL
ncbi:MAG: hypothetical protein K1Y36_11815 [Blastocatellia bacterium]|nr:hypothetical protein [Blastocatellia bacterium]